MPWSTLNRRELLDGFQRFVDVERGRNATHGRSDFAGRSDDESRALDTCAIGFIATLISSYSVFVVDAQIEGLGYLAVGIGGDWKFSCAIIRVSRKVIQPGDGVKSDADDRRAGGHEFIVVDCKGVRLNTAAAAICRRE